MLDKWPYVTFLVRWRPIRIQRSYQTSSLSTNGKAEMATNILGVGWKLRRLGLDDKVTLQPLATHATAESPRGIAPYGVPC